MCVNAYACVCKVPSNICGGKKVTIAKPTGVSNLGYLVYTSVVNLDQRCTSGLPDWAISRKMGDLKNDLAIIGLFRMKSICRNSFSSCSSTEITGTFSTEKPSQTRNTQLWY